LLPHIKTINEKRDDEGCFMNRLGCTMWWL
jgi:hypothetical protein